MKCAVPSAAVWIIAAVCLAVAAVAAETPAVRVGLPETIEDLMRTMADTPGVVAEFAESKHISLLEEPLLAKGSLYFIPPDRMARYTTEPGKSVLIIDGDRLAFEDEAGGDRIDLGANAVARVFVENFIVLFNGDLAELRRRYDATFTVDGERWALTLVPRREPIAKMIESIVLSGDGDGMKQMILREPGGDFTETRFTALDSSHHFPADEIARIFRREEPPGP